MTRRSFLSSLFRASAAIALSPLLPAEAFDWKTSPISFEGIPYHRTDATTGTWLGIERATFPWWTSQQGTGSRALTLEVIRAVDRLTTGKKNESSL